MGADVSGVVEVGLSLELVACDERRSCGLVGLGFFGGERRGGN